MRGESEKHRSWFTYVQPFHPTIAQTNTYKDFCISVDVCESNFIELAYQGDSECEKCKRRSSFSYREVLSFSFSFLHLHTKNSRHSDRRFYGWIIQFTRMLTVSVVQRWLWWMMVLTRVCLLTVLAATARNNVERHADNKNEILLCIRSHSLWYNLPRKAKKKHSVRYIKCKLSAHGWLSITKSYMTKWVVRISICLIFFPTLFSARVEMNNFENLMSGAKKSEFIICSLNEGCLKKKLREKSFLSLWIEGKKKTHLSCRCCDGASEMKNFLPRASR